jgi:histidinol-phosphate/aromatic aminotransferase/cobyric acid decarboxylase-like protein
MGEPLRRAGRRVVQAIQELHGVKAENIILGCGSGELLSSITIALLIGDPKKKVLGVNPTYGDPYSKAAQIGRETIRVPLNKDYTQNIPAIIDIANKRAAEIGFVYIVNPNNPTGMIVPKAQIKQLLDGIPKDMPVLIDEAYHHFVDSPDYESSMKYVLEDGPSSSAGRSPRSRRWPPCAWATASRRPSSFGRSAPSRPAASRSR